MTNSEDEKTKLLSELERVIEKETKREAVAQDVAKQARTTIDTAQAYKDYYSLVPSDARPADQWADDVATWTLVEGIGERADEAQPFLERYLVSSAAAVTTASTNVGLYTVAAQIAPQNQARFEIVKNRLDEVLRRSTDSQHARNELIRLRLHVVFSGNRSCVELLDEAVHALELDAGPGSILVPLRECINRALAELMRRSHIQVKGDVGKRVAAIGGQSAREDFDSSHFERLGSRFEMLKLSESKQAAMSRNQVVDEFGFGLRLLISLLGSIDETRLRAPT